MGTYRLSLIAKKGGRCDPSLLHEMQDQEGNEGCQGRNHEEWEASNSGCLSDMWDQDVQDREELEPNVSQLLQAGHLHIKDTQPVFRARRAKQVTSLMQSTSVHRFQGPPALFSPTTYTLLDPDFPSHQLEGVFFLI